MSVGIRLYLAGPMSGLPDVNYPTFERASQLLHDLGYEVVSPHKGHATPADLQQAAELGVAVIDTPEYKALLDRTTISMLSCSGVALLPGWQNSYGAQHEVSRAIGAGIPVKPIDDWENCAPTLLRYTGSEGDAPVKAYPGDAGYDLFVSEDTKIHVGVFVDVPLGISVQLPPGIWAMLTGRSSTIRRGLLVTQGIIDNGYTGSLFAGVQNVGAYSQLVERGERIAQLIPFRVEQLAVRRVGSLEERDRGTNAFGSTGR